MFGFGSSSNTPVNNRLKRAQQLRQQRLAVSNKAKAATPTKSSAPRPASATLSADDDDVLVISGACTIFFALVIVGLGAAMATLFFMIHQPECLKGLTFGVADLSMATADIQQKIDAPKAAGLRRLQQIPQLDMQAVNPLLGGAPQ